MVKWARKVTAKFRVLRLDLTMLDNVDDVVDDNEEDCRGAEAPNGGNG